MQITQQKINKLLFKEIEEQLCNKARNDFGYFVKIIFEHTVAQTKYIQTFHTEVLIKIIQLLKERKLKHKKVIISIPPGHTKTLICNVLSTAWLWGHFPSLRIILGSNGQQEANKRNAEVREILDTELYKKIFPNIFLESDDVKWIKTNKQGGRLAVTTDVAKRFTGTDADFLIVDDPNDSNATRLDLEKCNDWFYKKAVRRLRKDDFGYLIIQQRINKMDLTGYILSNNENNDILHIILKAFEDEDTEIKIPLIDNTEIVFKRKAGYLWDDKNIIEKYEEIKQKQEIWETQFQQNPIDSKNIIIKNEWFNYYNYNDYLYKDFTKIFLTGDTAAKKEEIHDYTVFCCWGICENNLYLLDMSRGKWEINDIRKNAINIYERWKNGIAGKNRNPFFYIEDKMSGITLIQDLQKFSGIPIKPVQRTKDKSIRLSNVINQIEVGRVYLPQDRHNITQPFIEECINFRRDNTHKHDDIVDNLIDAIDIGISNIGKKTSWMFQ